MVRLWWNSCEKRVFNVVDKFTSKYVSSVLSSQEISSVQTSTQLFNGMTVRLFFLSSYLLEFFANISRNFTPQNHCDSVLYDCNLLF